MIYLAVPYSHKKRFVMHQRVTQATEFASRLLKAGVPVFSVMTYTHPIAVRHGLPTNWKFWAAYNREIISWCEALILLTLPGWDTSEGVGAEVRIARGYEMPVHEVDPYNHDDFEKIVNLYKEVA